MAKNLNMVSLKETGGLTTEKKKDTGRKENLPDLTTNFANALTQGADSLTKNTPAKQVKKAVTTSSVPYKNEGKQDIRNTAQKVISGIKRGVESLDQKLGDIPSAAMSSLAGTTTPNQNRDLYEQQNRHGGNIVTSTRAESEAEKAGRWEFLSWLDKKAGEVPNVATASLVGSNASAEDTQAAQARQNSAVSQLTEWVTGNEISDALINLDEKAEAHRNKSEQLQQEAFEKYGQYETEGGRYVDEIFSNAGANALRWGKRAALMALGVPMELLNAASDASMFMSAAGDAVREAEEMGSSDTATALHALFSGAAEAGFEHLTDPLNIAGYSFGVGDAVDNAIKKSALKPAMKFLLTLGAHAKLEGVEELFTEAVQGLSRKYALGQNVSGKEIALDSLKADLAGTLSSFLLMGLGGDADYTQYKEDLAMYYWNMSEEQKTDVAELLGNAFGKDPALIRRSMDDRAFDEIKQMDGQTLMRAVNNAPVFIDPRTDTSIYEVTKYTKDQQKAKDFADRLGVKMNAVEDIESVAGDNGKQYIADGFVTPDDTILISAASPTPIQDTLFHEVVHSASNTPEGQEFINFAQEAEQAERGAEGYREYYDGVVDAYRNVYDPNSQKFASQVGEEIAAKFTKRLAADPDTMERIYRRNGNMFQRIYQGIRDAVATFDNTENLTDEQKTLLKTEKLYSNMLKRMRRDAILDGMGLGEGDVINSQTIGENIREIVNRGKRGEPMTNASQAAFSLAMNDQMMQKAKEVNKKNNYVSQDVMEIAEQQRLAVQQLMMQPKVLAVLPADDTTTNGKANTKMKNGSYGISEENTTVCVRMMSNEYVLDRISERIGRPLNVSESLKISQMFMQWAAKAQCLYCYEGMDRWAKREFHNRWFDARDYVVGRLQGGADYNEVYDEYLDKFLGRKPGQRNGATDKRMQMWQRIANGDIEAMPRAALASVDARDKAWTEHPEWREQLKNADGYAQSASYAKKKIAYTAYDGHILNWSQKFVDQLNSDFGMRMYSFSDFSKAFILENMQMVTDAAVKGLKGLSYTKEADFVKIFAPSGMLINCSIFGMNGQNGVERDEMQGMKWDEARALRDKYPNVGIIFVATNDQQVEWGLDQDWIDVVIPFHTVKTGEQVAAALNFTNYKGMQEDRKLPGWDKTKHVKSISPAMHNNDLQTYLRLCEENHLSPRFPEWMNHPNYMKLVVETRMPYNEAQPLQPVFDTSEVETMLNDFARRGGFENEGYGSVKIPLTEVSNRLADAFVRDGGASYTAGNRIGQARYSLSDEELDRQYFDALNRGDEDEARRLRYEHAGERGYTDHVYHGTKQFGFTEPDVSYSDDKTSFFVTDSPTTAQTYSGANNIRRISGDTNVSDEDIWEQEQFARDKLIDFATAVNRLSGIQGFVDIKNLWDNLYGYAERTLQDTGSEDLVWDGIQDSLDQYVWDAFHSSHDEEDDFDDWVMSNEANHVMESQNDITHALLDLVALENQDDSGIYDLLMNPDNMLRFDAHARDWNDIQTPLNVDEAPPIGRGAKPGSWSTRTIAPYAKRKGYSGVDISNLIDDGGRGRTRANASNVSILFDPSSQVKSADTVTYDNNGNIIPLSQRDNPDNPDIRYSLSDEEDPTYYKDLRFDTVADRDAFAEAHPNYVSAAELGEIEDWELYDEREDEREKALRDFKEYERPRLRRATVRELFEHPERFSHNDLDRFYDEFTPNSLLDFYDNPESIPVEDIVKDTIEAFREDEGYAEEWDNFLDSRFLARVAPGASNEEINRVLKDHANAIRPQNTEDVPTDDASYMAAVMNSDTELQQQMVDARARGQGYDTPHLYHGTPTGGFTEFDPGRSNRSYRQRFGKGMYFADREDVANHYMWNRDFLPEDQTNPMLYDVYLNSPDRIVRDVRDGTPLLSDVYVARNPNQIKSAEPITYDDNGNVIPLSQRFNPESNDIRYSLGEQYPSWEDVPEQEGNWGYHAGDLGKAEPRGSQGYDRGTGHFGTGTYFVGNPSELRYGYSDRPVESVDFSQYNLFNPQNSDDAYALHEYLKAVDGRMIGQRIYSDADIEDYNARAYDAAESEDPNTMLPLIEEGRRILGGYFQDALDTVNRWGGTKFYDRETWDTKTDSIIPPVTNEELARHGSDTLYAIMDALSEYGSNASRGWHRYQEALNNADQMTDDVARALGVTSDDVRTLAEQIDSARYGRDDTLTDDSLATKFMKALGYEGVDTRNIPDFDNTRYGSVIYDLKGNDLERKQANGARFSLNEDIPEQANAFPDRNYPQDRGAMRMLGQMSRDRVAADPLTYESISPESFPVPDRIQDYIDLMEDEEDRKYGFDEAPEKELSDEDRDMYKSIAGNKSGALQGFATPTQMFNNMMGKTGEQREFFRDRYERPMFDTKKEYNANREQRWQALENMIKETGIEANTPESAAVQWYGEKAKPNEAGETIPYTLADLKKEFPNKWEDIVKMERFMRGMYDEYVGRINAALEQVYPNLEEKAQAQLESWRNKKRIYQDEIEMSRSPVANEYWEGEIAKLDKKIAKLEGDLESGEYFRNKRLNPRKDYFHHFQEVETKGIGGLKNILQASTLIDPELVGKSANTKPKSRWMSWLQRRGQGAYTADAVLGMGKYIDSAEYAIAFDPLIAQYRDEISKMVKATRDTKNANQLIQYLSSYTNQLAGKTASLDRTILDLLGEGNRGQLFNVLSSLNNRAKSNAVVGNIRSAVAQIFNIPNAMSIIKSNSAWGKGVQDYISAKLGNRELLDQSPFLQERYFKHNVDDLKARNTNWEKITGKLGDITNAMMELGDREATELIWLAAYNEGKDKGVSDPVYYADDLTRQSVAGRGIGEVPYNMKSKVASFFMPFQVETNNAWQNMKGMLRDKDGRGIFRLMLGSFLMNAMVKPLFNDGVVPDILSVILEGIKKLFDKDREESAGEVALDTAKRMAGEAVSYIPGTSLWLPAIMSSETAEDLFGESDPTRYGTGTVGLSTITKTLADAVNGDGFDLMTPLLQLGLPYGGRQASRLYNTLQDFNALPSNGVMNTPFGGEKTPATGDYSKAGALKYRLPDEVDSGEDLAEILRAFAFGSNATNAAAEYFETGKPALSKERVEKLRENPEVNADTYIDYLREANTDGKAGISQAEAYKWLSQQDLTDEEKNALWNMTSSSWTKSYDEYTPQNETLVNEADADGNGRVTQAEAYDWLSKQDIPVEDKEAMWAENGWKKSYKEYSNNLPSGTESDDEQTDAQQSSATTPTTTKRGSALDELLNKSATSPVKTGSNLDQIKTGSSGITNRKELLIAADSNNDGYMSQKEAYAYLSNSNLSDEEKNALWNLSNWKTSYDGYAKKHGA